MKYNVGDRVRIKNFDWFRNEGANMVVVYMTKYYGEVVTITSVHKGFYRIKEDGGQYCWIDEMFECKVEEETKPELKFKVGDKVRIKSIDWYIMNKDKDGFVHCGDSVFDNYMSVFCGSIVTIGGVGLYGYDILEDMHCRTWTDEMIKGLVEEETKPKFKVGDEITNGKATLTILNLLSEKYVVKDNFGECGILYFNSQDEWKIVEEETKPKYEDEVNGEYYSTPKYLVRPSGYQFVDENGNIINATKIVLEKKKKEYPKLFVDCCTILYPNDNFQIVSQRVKGHKGDLLFHFQKLLICRDAYWKIYGEEMGLGKPWEPDWNNISDKYCIYFVSGDAWSEECQTRQCPFAFPTEEMRDAFYENFKELINECKELL